MGFEEEPLMSEAFLWILFSSCASNLFVSNFITGSLCVCFAEFM